MTCQYMMMGNYIDSCQLSVIDEFFTNPVINARLQTQGKTYGPSISYPAFLCILTE